MTKKRLETCADCDDFPSCETLQNWYRKAGGKYRRYRESAEYIREHGYESFIEIADGWKDSRGRLK